MDLKDLELYKKLERKMDDNTITPSEEEEYWDLWRMVQYEEEDNLMDMVFGY